MVARLWWKDLRQFGPIWVLLAVLALAAQPLLVRYGDPSLRTGALGAVALFWTGLYAVAVAAAAFAGERENRTLGWLDGMGAERSPVWLAKSSFALVSTLVLGLLLLAAAAVSTEQWTIDGGLARGTVMGTLFLLVLLGVGLMWSAVLSNALLAAVLAVGTGLCAIPLLDAWIQPMSHPVIWSSPWLPAVAAAFWLASWLFFVRTGPPRNALFPRRFRRPPLPAVPRPVAAARPTSFRGPAVRSLLWQTWREARALLGWLLLVAVALPPTWEVLFGPVDNMVWVGAVLLASLLAGVAVFGNDLRRGSNRMLANHGVRPGVVWMVRVAIWLAVVVGVACLGTAVRVGEAILGLGRLNAGETPLLPIVAALGFCLPVLCGMVFRRGITAGVIAILLSFLIALPIGMLFTMNLLPPIFLVLVPLGILGVTLAWSGDWLVERPGLARWLRLAGWCLGISAALFAAYTAVRAYQIPAIDPSLEARLVASPAAVHDADNAAPLYREAVKASVLGPSEAAEIVATNQKALALIRQATARPTCQFENLEKMTVFEGWTDRAAYDVYVVRLLEASIGVQRGRGELDGAWKDIMTLFRLARHRMSNIPVGLATIGLNHEGTATRLALAWAADARQTAARLREARRQLASLRALDVTEPIRVEGRILRNSESLPRAELMEKALAVYGEPRKEIPPTESLRVELMTTPWERARAGRAWRLLLAWYLDQAGREPWEAARGGWADGSFSAGAARVLLAPPLVDWVLQTTPLLDRFLPPIDAYLRQWDRNEVGRRALVQVLAIRAWQLDHGGQLPERLEDLATSGELDSIPTDPYTPNRQFGYVSASGQALLRLDHPGVLSGDRVSSSPPRTVDSGRLLYSVGPDRQDDRATRNLDSNLQGDIIFPLAGPGK